MTTTQQFDQQFQRDVDAMLANSDVVAMLSEEPGQQLDREALLYAWDALDDRQRLLWLRFHGLDGWPRATRRDLKEQLGISNGAISSTITSMRLELQMAASGCHKFPGLKPAVRNVVLRAGVRDPAEVPHRLDDVIDERGMGQTNFRTLEKWMLAHGFPSLVPLLDERAQQHLGYCE